jgi:hypothetical protein
MASTPLDHPQPRYAATYARATHHPAPRIDAVKAVGKASQQDYQEVLEPLLDETRRANHRVRLLYQLVRPGIRRPHRRGRVGRCIGWPPITRLIEGLALVTDVNWIRDSSRLLGFFMPGPVRLFAAVSPIACNPKA